MTKLFLKVNKDLFKLGLNPTELLILAQIIEFDNNTGDCFISDEVLAENFGVSKSTISRSIKSLVDKGLVNKDTKNAKGGKIRHLSAKIDKIEEILKEMKKEEEKEEEQLTKVNLTVDNESKSSQMSNCLLTTSNLTIDKEQNDSIKDKGIDKGIDKKGEEIPVEGSMENPIAASKEWLADRYNLLTPLANGLFMYAKKFYKIA